MTTPSQATWWTRLEWLHNESRDSLTRRAWHQAIQAASRAYTSNREQLAQKTRMSPAMQLAQHGYYGVMHALMVQAICTYFRLSQLPFRRLIDIGCHTGVTGLTLCTQIPTICAYLGLEPQPWAVKKARQLQPAYISSGKILSGTKLTWKPEKDDLILLSFVLNEMTDSMRQVVQKKLLEHLHVGAGVLIIEPIARHVSPWWDAWQQSFSSLQCDAVEFQQTWPIQTPQAWLDSHHGAGFRHQRWKARSLWICHPNYFLKT